MAALLQMRPEREQEVGPEHPAVELRAAAGVEAQAVDAAAMLLVQAHPAQVVELRALRLRPAAQAAERPAAVVERVAVEAVELPGNRTHSACREMYRWTR